MAVRTDPTTLQLGDSILIETSFEQVPLVVRGRLSNLLPKIVWVNVADPGCPPLVNELKEGHPIRLSAARDSSALVGETTFRSCLGLSRRLVAVDRPKELRLVDRRAQLRIAMRRSIGIRLARNSAAGEGGYFAMGSSIDVSLDGMRFETNVQMAVGDHVFVTLVLDQKRPLHALAQIVRLDDPITDRPLQARPKLPAWHDGQPVIRAAVKWEAMCPADRESLQSFLLAAERAASG